jgi:GrpB-like predicted nucleotidyltransferase (UPF0157 family)
LHVVEERSSAWVGWLAFRDYLRAHHDVAVRYATLKSSLASDHGGDPNDREAYRAGKATFIQDITHKALGERYPGLDSK